MRRFAHVVALPDPKLVISSGRINSFVPAGQEEYGTNPALTSLEVRDVLDWTPLGSFKHFHLRPIRAIQGSITDGLRDMR